MFYDPCWKKILTHQCVKVAPPMLKMDRWQVTFSTVQTPKGNLFCQCEINSRKAGGSNVAGHLFSSPLWNLAAIYILYNIVKRTSSFSQGLLAEKDFIRDQKPTLMADLLLLASEASACGAFKLKIMDSLKV